MKRYFTLDRILILSLLLLNLLLKILYIRSSDICIDEPFTIFYAQSNMHDLFEMLRNENNPPLFFLLLHFWIRLFGIGPAAVRALPVIFSSLAVSYIYKTGRLNYNRIIALTASLVYTFSNLNILHAHNTRVYSLFVLLASASMYYYMALITKDQKTAAQRGLIISNLLLAYSHFFGFFIILLQLFFTLTVPGIRKNIFRLHLWATIIFSLFYSPYLYIFITRFISSSSQGTWVAPPEWIRIYQEMWMFSNGPENARFFLSILALGLLIFLLKRPRIKASDTIILGWFVLPYLFMFFISFKIPMFLDNYLIYITPGYYLCLAVAVYHIALNRNGIAVVLGLALIWQMQKHADLNYNPQRFPSQVAAEVDSLRQPETPVYIAPAWVKLNIAYYLNRTAFSHFEHIDSLLQQDHIYPIYNGSNIDSAVLSKAPNALLVDGWLDLTDPKGTIKSTLETRFDSLHTTSYNGYKVLHYFHPKDSPGNTGSTPANPE